MRKMSNWHVHHTVIYVFYTDRTDAWVKTTHLRGELFLNLPPAALSSVQVLGRHLCPSKAVVMKPFRKMSAGAVSAPLATNSTYDGVVYSMKSSGTVVLNTSRRNDSAREEQLRRVSIYSK